FLFGKGVRNIEIVNLNLLQALQKGPIGRILQRDRYRWTVRGGQKLWLNHWFDRNRHDDQMNASAFQLVAKLNDGFERVRLDSFCRTGISAARPAPLEGWIKKSWPSKICYVGLVEQPAIAAQIDLFVAQTQEFRGKCLCMGKSSARNERIALKGLFVALETTHENAVCIFQAAHQIAVRGVHQRRPRLARVLGDLVGSR